MTVPRGFNGKNFRHSPHKNWESQSNNRRIDQIQHCQKKVRNFFEIFHFDMID